MIILHNKKWTENRTMHRSYLLNFTGEARIIFLSLKISLEGDNEFLLRYATDSNHPTDVVTSFYSIDEGNLKMTKSYNGTEAICWYKPL